MGPCDMPILTSQLRGWKISLQSRQNGRNGVSNHRCRDGLLYCLFGRRSKKTPKLPVTGLCEGNSPVTGEFPSQSASEAENASIWWRHHVKRIWIFLIFSAIGSWCCSASAAAWCSNFQHTAPNSVHVSYILKSFHLTVLCNNEAVTRDDNHIWLETKKL